MTLSAAAAGSIRSIWSTGRAITGEMPSSDSIVTLSYDGATRDER
jgi:archaeosine-15-forming tRNA-guanine transglycosylase